MNTDTSRQQQAAATTPAKDHHVMKVETSRFGTIEVDTEKIISFVQPFLGFPESSRFILQPHGPESPCMWLQSLDNPKLAFVVIHPARIILGYEPEISPYIKQELTANSTDELDILVILTIPRDNPTAVTANLLGPIVINVNKRLAKQVLLDPLKHDCCWPIGSKTA